MLRWENAQNYLKSNNGLGKMALIYLDTNIYIDHFRGRVDKLRPLGEFAFQILRRALECEFTIIFSSLVFDELLYNTYEKEIKELVKSLNDKNKIIIVAVSEEDRKRARSISKERKTSFNDTVHAVVAQRAKASVIVTRNLRDFEELQDIIKVSLPEES